MKRPLLLPAFLLISMLSAGPALTEDNAQIAEGYITTGIRMFDEGQNEAYANLTKLDEAAAAFTKALQYDPDSTKARYYLGLTCLAMDARRCAEEQHRLLEKLDAGMAAVLKAKIAEYKAPGKFEYVGTKGKVWTPPVEEKKPPAEGEAPASADEAAAAEAPPGGKGCEIVTFSTFDKPAEVRQFAQGGTGYGKEKRCVTATIKNTGASKVGAKDLMIIARFSDGDTMKERITDGLSDMDMVEPGDTVTGSVCFEKEKASITVVECDRW